MKMLLKVDLKCHKGTLYKCDRCGKQGSKEQIRGIYRTNDSGRPVKVYDLCERCWRAFERGIQIYLMEKCEKIVKKD